MRRAAVGAALALVACANPNRAELEANRDFDCRDRSASYLAVGSMVAPEAGVQLDCREAGPRLRRWTVSADGTRDEAARSMTVRQFEALWAKIDGVGWRFLKDCVGTGGDDDPTYSFEVVDWNGAGAFACQHRGPLPHPYFVIVDQLDLAAAEFITTPTSNRKGPDDP